MPLDEGDSDGAGVSFVYLPSPVVGIYLSLATHLLAKLRPCSIIQRLISSLYCRSLTCLDDGGRDNIWHCQKFIADGSTITSTHTNGWLEKSSTTRMTCIGPQKWNRQTSLLLHINRKTEAAIA